MTENQLQPVVIEHNKTLSKCALWEWQRTYFDQHGIEAWADQVPFYVTSNPFIANGYANIAMQWIREWINKHGSDARKQPFYVLELGTGSGRFSFFVLQKMQELQQTFGLTDVKICYVMSDFTAANIKYWEKHPALQPFLEKGMLDFAVYDLEQDNSITLIRQNVVLTPETIVNPLVVFGNYIFDTVSHDAFRIHEGSLQELRVKLSTPPENIRDGKPVDCEKIHIDYKAQSITAAGYYPDEHLNKVLAEYQRTLKDTNILFPIGSFRAIQKLLRLSRDRLVLVASDNGHTNLESLEGLEAPSPAFHSSFSMMVNFHAIGRYFQHRGGDAVLQTPRKGIKTSAFCSGFKFSDMPETAMAVRQFVEEFSPADYFILHRNISDTYQNSTLEILASHMALTDWDPHMYLRLSGRICSLLNDGERGTVNFLISCMPRLMAHFYAMPATGNLAFEIAVFFHTLKEYQSALHYYKLSIPYAKAEFSLHYNLALCHYYSGQRPEALVEFKNALALNSESKEAREWVEFMEKDQVAESVS